MSERSELEQAKRSRFQMTIGGLLSGTLMVGLALGWYVDSARLRAQRDAAITQWKTILVDEVVRSHNAYCLAIREDEFDRAYRMRSSNYRQRESLDEFRRQHDFYWPGDVAPGDLYSISRTRAEFRESPDGHPDAVSAIHVWVVTYEGWRLESSTEMLW